ncbi:hypothetical protein WMF39_27780 [Sorangium sp. So ce1504]|uniref:hypothetical protein n=1 Tax=Sorangium sp. So ce1504 TaxID=3133337 RepID=UPI003F5DA2F1
MRYPINWVIGFILLLVAGGVVGGVMVFVFGLKVVRRLTWSRERELRRRLREASAVVESCSRITEAGHCALVLSFSPTEAETYRDAQTLTLRGMTVLHPLAIERAESARTLPIRFDPVSPSTIVVDTASIVAEGAESFEREAYIEYGRGGWKAA